MLRFAARVLTTQSSNTLYCEIWRAARKVPAVCNVQERVPKVNTHSEAINTGLNLSLGFSVCGGSPTAGYRGAPLATVQHSTVTQQLLLSSLPFLNVTGANFISSAQPPAAFTNSAIHDMVQ